MLRHDTRQKVGPATLFPQSAATYNPQHVSGGCYIRPIAPMPYQSGGMDRDRSISRAGNPRARTTLI